MSSVVRDAVTERMLEFLAEAGPFGQAEAAQLTGDQVAALAASGVKVSAGVPVIVQIVRERIVVPVTPEMGCISEQQCVVFGNLVRAIVETHHAPWQTVWSSLNAYMGVRSYRLIHAGAAPRAGAFLQHWLDTGLPPSS